MKELKKDLRSVMSGIKKVTKKVETINSVSKEIKALTRKIEKIFPAALSYYTDTPMSG